MGWHHQSKKGGHIKNFKKIGDMVKSFVKLLQDKVIKWMIDSSETTCETIYLVLKQAIRYEHTSISKSA